MFNARLEICTIIDRTLYGRPVGRSKAIYAENAPTYNIMLPYLGESENARAEAEAVLSLCRTYNGIPMVEGTLVSGGAILIRLAKPMLERLLIRAAETAMPSITEPDGDTPVGYAELKLRSLARGPIYGLCGAESELHLAWLLTGITAYPLDAARTRARLDAAARATTCLLKELPPKERAAMRKECALVGMAGARLISAGRRILETDL